MKTTNSIIVGFALALLSTLNPQLSTAFAQGSLTPPGAPAPTMKSLDQIEARTPITNTSSTVTISQPGSYYLTANLTVSTGDGIDINTNGVTLDLNGFTISSTAASATGNGILLASGLRNITLANGFIQGGVTNNGSGVYSGGGFNYGITYSGTAPVNVLVSRLSVSGCQYSGIYLYVGNSTVVEACTVRTVGSYGIFASIVKSCSALDCGSYAIDGVEVSDCIGQSSSSGYGLYATTAQNCYGYSSSYIGLDATIAQNCYGVSSGGGYGISAFTVQNCYGYSDGSSIGIYANEVNNCEGYSYGGIGIDASEIAIGSLGYTFTGTGIVAFIGNSCYGFIYSSGTTENVTHKYNMP